MHWLNAHDVEEGKTFLNRALPLYTKAEAIYRSIGYVTKANKKT